jgi:4a-hydroxytetrahydrobiopterin dehydratase
MSCSRTTTRLTEEEVSRKLTRLNGWVLGDNYIEKRYSFRNFLRAIAFVNAVAYAAESANHHPDIIVHYNEVTLRNWTHTAGGITEFDFALAERIDALIETGKNR